MNLTFSRITFKTGFYCLLAFTSIILLSCSYTEKIEESFEQGRKKKVRIYRKSLFSPHKAPVKYIEYHFNRNVAFETELKHGFYHGNCKSHFIRGGLKSKGSYNRGEKSNTWKYYYEKEKIVSAKGPYKRDKKNGIWKTYWNNSQLKSKGAFKSGKETGEWKYWYPTGVLKSVSSCFIHNDTGYTVTYHPNAKLKESFACKGTGKIGPYISYDKYGRLHEQGQYNEHLKKDGEWKTWYDGERVTGLYFYNNGLLNDTCRSWDSTGKLLSEGFFENGTGTLIHYYPNGTPKARESFLAGKKQGDHWLYYPSGAPSSQTIYLDDQPQSVFHWYDSKKINMPVLAMSGKFQEGKRHGLWLWFSEKRVLYESALFEKDVRHGISKYYNPKTGTLQRKQEFQNGQPLLATLSATPLPKQ
ncbi:MAG: hypothetical protein HQK83_09740 [Fibrobacteria bacterium]|nr:hypothetical protein [Fibrobacteria bacterium]